MTTHKKSPAAPTTEQTEHLPSNSDHQPTGSTATKRRRPGRRGYFHAALDGINDPDFIHTLCGERIPKRTSIRRVKAPNDPRPYCPACANLEGLQSDLDATMKRAEEIHQAMLTLARYLKEVD